MTLESVFDHWTLLEADYLAIYNQVDPLSLTWRKFIVLLRGLFPHNSRFLQAIWEESPERLREALRESLGYSYQGAKRRQVSLDSFVREIANAN